ncbi:MAG: flavodoxin [Clostridia bacterium]|nr:flavodoxin [Clostridia bacterium]
MKKLFSIILMSILTFGLVACADTSENKVADENSFVEESSTVTEETNKNVLQENITSEEKSPDEQETITEPSGKHILVVYFSVTGNTKTIAEKIATLTDADLYEIKPAVEYTDADIDYGDSNSRTSKEQNDLSVRPEIQSETISLEGYDTIYIGYPIWWGEEPRIMDTFVESYDFGDITMIPFCTSGSSGIGNSGKNLADNADSGNWLEGQRFSATASESELEDWISNLQ